MGVKLFTFCCAFVALCLLSEVMGARKPPGLPKPKTTSMTAAQEQALLQSCIRNAVKRKERTPHGKNFVLCFKDNYFSLKIKPSIGSVLTSMKQCSRPGGFESGKAARLMEQISIAFDDMMAGCAVRLRCPKLARKARSLNSVRSAPSLASSHLSPRLQAGIKFCRKCSIFAVRC
ncbi:hypothetical protein KUF71_010693 [Frankliniella fusca]|uniref:Uncharacterized protein n=1 Tax=Frankliniella fusca TaxID=407009 RepID=A0AAE1HHL2_9NEOP|nr:hypothetical protein KUF71_010693 [Frankliniella fusca]